MSVVSPNGDKIFVTDNAWHRLLTLARDRKVRSTFASSKLQHSHVDHVPATEWVNFYFCYTERRSTQQKSACYNCNTHSSFDKTLEIFQFFILVSFIMSTLIHSYIPQETWLLNNAKFNQSRYLLSGVQLLNSFIFHWTQIMLYWIQVWSSHCSFYREIC